MNRLVAIAAALLVAWVAESAQAQEFSARVLQRGSRATVRVVAFDGRGTPVSAGTGVMVSRRGYVLTNFHVVGNTRNGNAGRLYGRGVVRIDTVSDAQSRLQASYYGIVVRGDVRLDLAVVRVVSTIDGGEVPRRFPHLPLARGSAQPGRTIAALGFPVGVQSIEITYGHITNVIRDGFTHPSWLRLDARINPGSSGGPIIDRRGRVVGIATLIDHASAQPVEVARAVQAVPRDWLRDAAQRTPMIPTQVRGVVTLTNRWFEEVAAGVTGPLAGDILYYRVRPGAERVVVSRPAMEMAVYDATGQRVERGRGQVIVPANSSRLVVAVLVPHTRVRPRHFELVAVMRPVQTNVYTFYVADSTAASVPVGTECDITVSPSTSRRFQCRVVIECDGVAVYGAGRSGHNPICQTNADRVVVRVDDPRDNDGDPSMLFSLLAGGVRIATDSWRLTLASSPPAERNAAALPELPSRAAVHRVLADADLRVSACALSRGVDRVTARLTIRGTGEVESVELQGLTGRGRSLVRLCIDRVLEALEFPEFRRPTMRVDYSYVVGP